MVTKNISRLFSEIYCQIYQRFNGRSQKPSVCLDIIYPVTQGSMLGLLLFNIDPCDLSIEDCISDFPNLDDDTTSYECRPAPTKVMSHLEITTEKMFDWFSFNNLKANVYFSLLTYFRKRRRFYH